MDAVDGGVLQLERGAGAGAAAVAGAVDLDGAAGGADEIVQRVVEQQQAAAGVGDQELAVVGEIGAGEVLDDVGGAGVGLEQPVIGEAAGVVAVDDGGLQLERGAGAVAVGRCRRPG